MLSSILSHLFPNTQCRVLIMGLDASGKTSILYKWKIGELVTTIPTIGFNVEDIIFKSYTFTTWDVGGCDKIRPLWRHYFQNTNLVLFVVDSNDRERLDSIGEYSVTAELQKFLQEEELQSCPFLIIANKQDLPDAMSVQELTDRLDIKKLQSITTNPTGRRDVRIVPSSVYDDESLFAILDVMVEMIEDDKKGKIPQLPIATDSKKEPKKNKKIETANKMETQFEEWLSRIDESDDEFIRKLDDYSLESWDHRTHLRIAFVLLKRYGRRKGLQLIFEKIKAFIENSIRTQRSIGTTFHETMTYFWVHMVHYAMISSNITIGGDDSGGEVGLDEKYRKVKQENSTYQRVYDAITAAGVDSSEFKLFLLLNPHLANGGLFLSYYSKKLMLMTPESRTQVMLPDVKPLPSMISQSTAPIPKNIPLHSTPIMKSFHDMTDDEFLAALEGNSLPGWGHEYVLRIIYCVLQKDGRNRDSLPTILSKLRVIEKEYTNTTIAYFWLHMMTIAMAVYRKRYPDSSDGKETFIEFMKKQSYSDLSDSQLLFKYYSKELLSSNDCLTEFFLPDLKNLPNTL